MSVFWWAVDDEIGAYMLLTVTCVFYYWWLYC